MFKEKARPDYYVDFTASSGWFKHTRSLSMLSIHLQLGSLELAGEPGPCPPIPAPACVPTHTHTLAHTNSTNSLPFSLIFRFSYPPFLPVHFVCLSLYLIISLKLISLGILRSLLHPPLPSSFFSYPLPPSLLLMATLPSTEASPPQTPNLPVHTLTCAHTHFMEGGTA